MTEKAKLSSGQSDRNERFRPRLQKSLDELLELRRGSAQSRETVQLDQQSVGRLSRIDAMQAQQMALAADRKWQVQIERIQRALMQIHDGEFGYCLSCGQEIADGRLEADPTAYLCVPCANMRAL